jgi:formate/nitrite transporter
VGFVICGVALLVGGRLLYKAVLNEATNRIRLDLNAAREIYLSRIDRIKNSLNITSIGPVFLDAFAKQDIQKLSNRLSVIAQQTGLDFMGVVAKDGRTICRIGPSSFPKDNYPVNPIAGLAIQKQVGVAGTVVLNSEFLFFENPELADRARIRLLPTKMAAPRRENEEIKGMALSAAVPVFESGNFLGVLYGGVLINQSQDIVDKVSDTVFQHEFYNGRSIGTAVVKVAYNKVNLSFVEALSRGIGCNWLVCLAVWMALSARQTIGKIFAIFFPIMAFVALGFEHNVANMFYIPTGILFVQKSVVQQIHGMDLSSLNWINFLWKNLLPVTIGNIIGGSVFVGMSYWGAYLRPEKVEK